MDTVCIQPGLLDDKTYKIIKPKNSCSLREQPAYRVETSPDACTLAELLSVIVGGEKQFEIAARLLERFETVQKLSLALPAEIAAVPGVGKKTALRLKAALALARKLMEPAGDEMPMISSPRDAYQVLRPVLEGLDHERLVVMVLTTRNRVMEMPVIYVGSVNSANVRIAEVLRPCIRLNAPNMVLAHNHPTGDPTPSPEDVNLTRCLNEAARKMDIQLLDHVIVGGPGRYTSLKERGIGFS
jgi:DNA repair protein RadC